MAPYEEGRISRAPIRNMEFMLAAQKVLDGHVKTAYTIKIDRVGIFGLNPHLRFQPMCRYQVQFGATEKDVIEFIPVIQLLWQFTAYFAEMIDLSIGNTKVA